MKTYVAYYFLHDGFYQSIINAEQVDEVKGLLNEEHMEDVFRLRIEQLKNLCISEKKGVLCSRRF